MDANHSILPQLTGEPRNRKVARHRNTASVVLPSWAAPALWPFLCEEAVCMQEHVVLLVGWKWGRCVACHQLHNRLICCLKTQDPRGKKGETYLFSVLVQVNGKSELLCWVKHIYHGLRKQGALCSDKLEKNCLCSREEEHGEQPQRAWKDAF